MPKKSVLELINEVAANPAHKNEVSVLPLMCGTGKSTAISYKIKETIENADTTGNGLLIITDRKDRMNEYLYLHITEKELEEKPDLDHELVRFLWSHQNQVTIMTHDNLDEAYRTYNFRPVLMMTTQRFFRLARDEMEQFLKWEKIEKLLARPLIIIDERPELTTIVELNEQKIHNCCIAIEHAFQNAVFVPAGEVTSAEMAFNEFANTLNNANVGGKDDVYCFWSWYNNEISLENMQEHFSEIRKKRDIINNYAGGTYYEDNYTRIRGIFNLARTKALYYRHWTSSQICLNNFYTILDNTPLLKSLSAKTIILDGTAIFSPEYKLLTNAIRRYPEYDRRLNHLKIHVINLPTSKTRMKNSKYQKYVLKCVQMYYDEKIHPEIGQDYSKIALFTYKDIEKKYRGWLPKDRIEHFGNIVGKNDFHTAKHIIQVGLNRYPNVAYYLYYLALHPEEERRYENMQEAGYDTINTPLLPPEQFFEEWDITQEQWLQENSENVTYCEDKVINPETICSQSSEIKERTVDPNDEVYDIMNNLLLAEIEQNLFRGIIRHDSCAEDYHFHLFTNTRENSELIKRLEDRFEPLGGRVFADDSEQMILNRKLMRSGSSHVKQFINWHDTELNEDEEYKPTDIRKACGIPETPNGIKLYENMISEKKNPVLNCLLDGERVKRGVYKKEKNWVHQ